MRTQSNERPGGSPAGQPRLPAGGEDGGAGATRRQAERCAAHPAAVAAWRCRECGRALCPACAYSKKMQAVEMVACASCGGLADTIKTKRVIPSHWQMIPKFLEGMFQPAGLIQLFAVALVLYIFRLLGFLGDMFAFGILVGYQFRIIRKASAGQSRLPDPADFSNLTDDVVMPIVKFVLATYVVWIPVIWRLSGVVGELGLGVVVREPSILLGDPVLVLLIALALLVVPAALVVAAITESTVATLNPINILLIFFKLPRDFIGAAAVYWVVFLIEPAVNWLMYDLLPKIPIVTGLVFLTFSMFLTFLAAFVLGWVIFRNSEKLGLALPEDTLVPVVPDARPRGKERKPGGPSPRDEALPATGAATTVGPDEGSAMLPTGGESAQQTLSAHVRAGRGAQAAALYLSLEKEGAKIDLPPELQIQLADLLEGAGHAGAALNVYRDLAQNDLRGPRAAFAMYQAARLLGEKLDRGAEVPPLCSYLAENFPDDPWTRKAAELMRPR